MNLGELEVGKSCLVGLGVHNALTAYLGECAGFDLLWLSSLEMAAARRVPDANLFSYMDAARTLQEIAGSVRIPIIVDADNGYGSDEAAFMAARSFENAGASAMCIEDNAFPKHNSFHKVAVRRLETPEAFCQRLEAARSGSSRLAIVARTEALVAGMGVGATCERVHAYVEAGANIIFVQTTSATLPEFKEVLARVRGSVPLLITPTGMPAAACRDLYNLGIDIVVFSNVVIRTMVHSLQKVLADLRKQGSIASVASALASMERVFELSDPLRDGSGTVVFSGDLRRYSPK